MSDYTLNVLKMKSKKYEDYLNCINPNYNRDEELAYEVIIRFKEYEEQNKKYKEVIDKAIKCIDYNTKYKNSEDIYQFIDIKSEILEPLKDILEKNDNNGNAYLKEFNDWLKEVE